jgi:hypothetical protein
MTNTNKERPQALQAVLSRKNIEISCTIVFEDESTSYPRVFSVSVRGAQREITGMLVGDNGYVPAGRWSDDGQDDDGYSEWSRAFKPGQNATIIPWNPPRDPEA